MIETGTILQNRYLVEKQIGQGGMGKVYVATDERFNSTVAIKETVFEDKNLRKAFEREARLLNSLKHSALPRVSDHFDENEGQFLVMEFIAGEDLAEMMERNGEAFPLDEVLDWANQLCDALDYLHSQNIIHRDIKPQNLKLTPNGQIVLLDFGLAKGNPTDAQHQTAAKSIFGYSRNYASLEQIQGTGTEPRSDLYSLSATLYHLLTGIPPTDALTRAMNVLNGQPDPLLAANVINSGVPQGVAEVLQKAMALNAGERPQSAIIMRSMINESDKSISANAANYAVGNSAATNLLSQETKIMPATTDNPNVVRSEIETKISSKDNSPENIYKTKLVSGDFQSKETIIQTPSGNTNSPKRARVVGASVFGALLLVGIAFSALYFYSSEVQTNSNVETPVKENNESVVADQENKKNLIISNTNTANENSDVVAEDKIEPPKEIETPSQPLETVKKSSKQTNNQSKTSPKTEKSTKTEIGDDEMIVNGETIETKDMIIDEDGIRMKRPPIPPHPPRVGEKLPPTQFENLTPEQIKKLQELKNKRRVIVVEKPMPKPTP